MGPFDDPTYVKLDGINWSDLHTSQNANRLIGSRYEIVEDFEGEKVCRFQN